MNKSSNKSNSSSSSKKKKGFSHNHSKYDNSEEGAFESEIKESKHGYCEVDGKVIKVEASSRFKVEVCINEHTFIVDAYTSGHLKMNKIRIIQGDRVTLLVPLTFDPDAGLKGRIIHRKDNKK